MTIRALRPLHAATDARCRMSDRAADRSDLERERAILAHQERVQRGILEEMERRRAGRCMNGHDDAPGAVR